VERINVRHLLLCGLLFVVVGCGQSAPPQEEKYISYKLVFNTEDAAQVAQTELSANHALLGEDMEVTDITPGEPTELLVQFRVPSDADSEAMKSQLSPLKELKSSEIY
jgi:hypothetical protein